MKFKTLQAHLSTLPDGQVIANRGDSTVLVRAPFVEDSRQIAPGGVFVARAGRSMDGHDYIGAAITNGAVAVVGERPRPDVGALSVPYVQVQDGHLVTGRLAASFYDFPSRDLVVIGVTGTDGKTTTIHLLQSVLKRATNGRTGYISTIGADFGDHEAETGLHVTTPAAHEVQAYLAQMRDAGLTHVLLEMTSHGLDQGRLAGVDIDGAILTNITHEHLDYHGTFENYRYAKSIMFRMLAEAQIQAQVPKFSVLNADDPSFEYFAAIPADRVVSYGITNNADVRAQDIQFGPDGTAFMVGEQRFHLQLLGAFNVQNALAVIGACRVLRVDDAIIREGLAAVEGISGRMQSIDEGQDFLALVDFAHTPGALHNALRTARTLIDGSNRVIAVFGSAGLRDVEKRRLMAEVSAKLADMTVLTAEDPRTESLDDILQMMADGCAAQGGVEGETFMRVQDRGEAIHRACQMAQPGDIVLVCGKGHEQSMCFGTIEYPWDDRDALRAALRGVPLRTLPTAKPDDMSR